MGLEAHTLPTDAEIEAEARRWWPGDSVVQFNKRLRFETGAVWMRGRAEQHLAACIEAMDSAYVALAAIRGGQSYRGKPPIWWKRAGDEMQHLRSALAAARAAPDEASGEEES